MKRYIMIIDVSKCHGCHNCFLACKDEHVGNTWAPVSMPQPRHGQRWRNILLNERGQYPLIDPVCMPVNCMMCENAPCVKAGNGAIYRRDDGLVLIDNDKAVGRKDLVGACPYHAIWWNEELKAPRNSWLLKRTSFLRSSKKRDLKDTKMSSAQSPWSSIRTFTALRNVSYPAVS